MEEFFKDNQFTFAAISTIGTMLAVIISLIAVGVSIYLASRKNKPKIKAVLSIIRHGDYFGGNETIDYEFIICKIKNIGSCVVEIDEDSFKICGKTIDPIDMIYQDYTTIDRPYDDFNYEYYGSNNEPEVYNPLAKKLKQYPFCIKSGDSAILYILGKYGSKIDDKKFFKQSEEKEINIKDTFSFNVVINDNFNFKARIDDNLKHRIKKIIKK